MHAIHRTRFASRGKKFLATNCTCHNVANEWIAFWKVCSEIHFLPLVAFLNAKPWKTKIRADCVGSYEVDLPIFRLDVDILRMLLFVHLFHVEHRRVVIKIVEHVRVLVSSKPFVLPIKADRLGAF